MKTEAKPRPTFKVWLETDEGYVFGPGVYSILKKVEEAGTLKDAAKSLGMSYRYAWGLVRRAEEKIGQPLLVSHKGGRAGGGGASLTEVGIRFMKEFSKIEALISTLSQGEGSDLGQRTLITGIVEELTIADENMQITLKLAEGTRIKLGLPMPLAEEKGVARGRKLEVEFVPVVIRLWNDFPQ